VKPWERPPEELRISTREAHVWMLSTDASEAQVRSLSDLLSEEERARAERIRHAATRSGFVATRSALRSLLGRYLGGDPARLRLQYSTRGKPALEAQHNAVLHFSVAHSGGIALLAFARVEVGIDVERVRRLAREAKVTERLFAGRTRALLESLPPAQRLDAFFAAWTQREALVKAVGGALLVTRDPLDFEWPRQPGPRIHRVPHDDGREVSWTVATIPPATGFAATLVTAGELDEVRHWRFGTD
jgi:4'-phosphopantetheinyl transferase